MFRVHNRFEPQILEAIHDFENEFSGDPVTWEASMDFYPDIERATEDNVPLVATVGIYLEIPGPSVDTVISGSIFVPPSLEEEQIYKAVFDSLVALRQQRSTAPSPVN